MAMMMLFPGTTKAPRVVRIVLSSSKHINKDDVDKFKNIVSIRVIHPFVLEAQLNHLR